MPGATFIEGEKIDLKTIEEEDLEFLRDTINNPDVRKFLTVKTPKNLEQERDFFENVVSSDENVNLAISVDGEITGIISLNEDDKEDRVAEIGLWINPDYHGNGYGTEAAELITDYGFNELNYHKIFAKAYETNEASKRIWEKLGFEREGVLRSHVFRRGSFEDTMIYGVLEEEWG